MDPFRVTWSLGILSHEIQTLFQAFPVTTLSWQLLSAMTGPGDLFKIYPFFQDGTKLRNAVG